MAVVTIAFRPAVDDGPVGLGDVSLYDFEAFPEIVHRCGLFFFFQAEDGIRYKLVTGVQTCALPISTGINLFGELALNVSDTIGEIPCNKVLFVSMKTRASTSLSAELKDRTKVKPVNFTIFNPAGANANGNALAARVQDPLLGINQTLPTSTPATCTQGVCSSQSGIGSTSNSNQVLNVAVPPPGGSILKANVLSASSTSTVDPTTNSATDTGVAEAAGVNLVGGLVTADVVRGVAAAQAQSFNSSFSSAGSAFNNLVVNGTQLNNVNPNTTIDLPAAQFGAGSFVKLLEETGSSSQPPRGQLTGGG